MSNKLSLDEMFEELAHRKAAVTLKKMSGHSAEYELSSATREAMFRYGPMPWRCSIGAGSDWRYGATAQEAVAGALHGQVTTGRLTGERLRDLRKRADFLGVVNSVSDGFHAAPGRLFCPCCHSKDFVVNAKHEVVHCFSCHESGDVFWCIKRFRKCDLGAAVDWLEQWILKN